MNYITENYSKQKKVCFIMILFAFAFLDVALSADAAQTDSEIRLSEEIKKLKKEINEEIPAERNRLKALIAENRETKKNYTDDKTKGADSNKNTYMLKKLEDEYTEYFNKLALLDFREEGQKDSLVEKEIEIRIDEAEKIAPRPNFDSIKNDMIADRAIELRKQYDENKIIQDETMEKVETEINLKLEKERMMTIANQRYIAKDFAGAIEAAKRVLAITGYNNDADAQSLIAQSQTAIKTNLQYKTEIEEAKKFYELKNFDDATKAVERALALNGFEKDKNAKDLQDKINTANKGAKQFNEFKNKGISEYDLKKYSEAEKSFSEALNHKQDVSVAEVDDVTMRLNEARKMQKTQQEFIDKLKEGERLLNAHKKTKAEEAFKAAESLKDAGHKLDVDTLYKLKSKLEELIENAEKIVTLADALNGYPQNVLITKVVGKPQYDYNKAALFIDVEISIDNIKYKEFCENLTRVLQSMYGDEKSVRNEVVCHNGQHGFQILQNVTPKIPENTIALTKQWHNLKIGKYPITWNYYEVDDAAMELIRKLADRKIIIHVDITDKDGDTILNSKFTSPVPFFLSKYNQKRAFFYNGLSNSYSEHDNNGYSHYESYYSYLITGGEKYIHTLTIYAYEDDLSEIEDILVRFDEPMVHTNTNIETQCKFVDENSKYDNS